MSNNSWSDSNNGNNAISSIIVFQVTDDMKKIGIKDFIFNRADFEFTFISRRKCCILFSPKKTSISVHIKSIEKKLYQDANVITEDQKAFGSAIADIENQLIEHRDKIFDTSNHDDSCKNSSIHTYNGNTQKILEQIRALKQQVKESNVTSDEWRAKLIEKYEHLRKLTLQLLPELWLPLEFVISTKSILNIKGGTLPFMAVLLAPPSSMKTIALDIFIDYPHTYTTDEFTPSSFVSHNSALTEEQLQKVDMLPKMVDNLCIFPELAPLFTAKIKISEEFW